MCPLPSNILVIKFCWPVLYLAGKISKIFAMVSTIQWLFKYAMVSTMQLYNVFFIARSLNNDLPDGNVLILIFSIYSLVNKKVLLCKWVLESENRNISILRKPP